MATYNSVTYHSFKKSIFKGRPITFVMDIFLHHQLLEIVHCVRQEKELLDMTNLSLVEQIALIVLKVHFLHQDRTSVLVVQGIFLIMDSQHLLLVRNVHQELTSRTQAQHVAFHKRNVAPGSSATTLSTGSTRRWYSKHRLPPCSLAMH